jgi:hypothetical protein
VIDNIEWSRLARQRSRARKYGAANPFCCLCGERHWAVRFDLHHFALRKFDPRTIRLCRNCHEKVHDMLKDFPPLPPGMDARLARLVLIVRGRMVLFGLALETDRELHDYLTGAVPLPPLPTPESEGGDND